jgi:LasA protease
MRKIISRFLAPLLLLAILASGCVKTPVAAKPWKYQLPTPETTLPVAIAAIPSRTPFILKTRDPNTPIYTPTPDNPHTIPTPRTEDELYVVQRGDSLGIIAQRYGVDINTLIQANKIPNPDLLEVGQALTIPAPNPMPSGPDFKIIPDSELVYSPSSVSFNTSEFIDQTTGYLRNYRDEIDQTSYSAAEVIVRVAGEYSVNPRILLSVLEYQSNWVTLAAPAEATLDYPIGYRNSAYKGLYRQLAWTANNLNRGYYLWKSGGISAWILADGSVVPPATTLNHGTAGVQHLFSLLYDQAGWQLAVTQNGLFTTFQNLFGYPFDYSVDPLIPEDLQQPLMQLPFEPGAIWSFTGGPHGGWGSGSAWAAIDFAPPGDALGCVQSDAWVTAVADGLITHADNGAVIEDLDGDGTAQTGWSVLYMHIETRDRVKSGDQLKAGDRIGHPSCEGGVSNGTHVHLARRYNGEWIPADAGIPFILDGWISSGNGVEYDGWLTRDGQTVEAWNSRTAENQINR